jgi:tetratricopeptide (TPR) repeat protein
MPERFFFVSYSRRDGEPLAYRLGDDLTAGPPSIAVWLDRRRLQPGIDWDEQLVEALRTCEGVLYVMTPDSVSPRSECKKEWTRALKYKKPVIPLLFHAEAELPYRLEPREYIDFTRAYEVALARLRAHVGWRGTAEGGLQSLGERLEDARRDLTRAEAGDRPRIEDEIAQLERQIEVQQRVVADPRAADQRVKQSIERGLERERQPATALSPAAHTRFINPPPLTPPSYFQDRHVETGLIGDFLKDAGMRLMTVVGRGGVGKTAMVCRLLKALEGGRLPDEGGALPVDGIVYLSARSHGITFPNLFADLARLLPEDTVRRLDRLYQDAQQTTEAQVFALLEAFPAGRTVVLLDNFEDVVDAEAQTLGEGELAEALRAFLTAPAHAVKIIITTRVAPRDLLRLRPALQRRLDLDEGLTSPFAENILRAMDADGKLGLRQAPDALLGEARERTRGYPRALEAIVGILSADRDTTLPELLADMAQLLPEASDVVEALVGEAFNRLDAGAQQVVQALAVYGTPVSAVAVDYLLQPHRRGIDSGPVVGRLVNMQFARRDGDRYYVHQVDRQYALTRLSEGERGDRTAQPPPFTQYALRHRAGDYFKETRKPRATWRSLEDLSPQIAEFELRCAGADYETAASVLLEFDFDTLIFWGHYRLMAEMHERLQGKLTDPSHVQASAGNLGVAYTRMGQYERALRCTQLALEVARERKDRRAEAAIVDNLGGLFTSLGDSVRALELHGQALTIAREIGDQSVESSALGNLANRYSALGRMAEAIDHYHQALAFHRELEDRRMECLVLYNLAGLYSDMGNLSEAHKLATEARSIAQDVGYRLIEIATTLLLANLMVLENRLKEALPEYRRVVEAADALGDMQFQFGSRLALAWGLMRGGEVAAAAIMVEEATGFRFERSYYELHALRGVVAWRQANQEGARAAFRAAVGVADERLRRQATEFAAAYARALALAGLALSQDAALVRAASEAYRSARAITAGAGLVAEALQNLDALAIADPAGLLKPVRASAAGEA